MTDFGVWETKIWGRTRCLEDNDRAIVHELECVQGGFCSFHFHMHRSNIFKVLNGKIRLVMCMGSLVQILDLDGTLQEKPSYSIPSRIPHQFQVLESGQMIEVYYPDGGDCLSGDIVRISVGGFSKLGFPEKGIYKHDEENGNLLIWRPEVFSRVGG